MEAGTHLAVGKFLTETVDLLIFRIATLFALALNVLASVRVRVTIGIEVVIFVAKDTGLPTARGRLREA